MTLMNRVTRLFRADLHAVLDRIEEPDLLLRQAVREMEEDLGRDRRRLELLGEGRRGLESRRDELGVSLSRIGEELDVCLDAGKEDLARTLIRRRLEAERVRDLLQRKSEDLARDLARLQDRIAGNAGRLEAMRRQAELLETEAPAGRAEESPHVPGQAVREEDVEVALLRERQRRAQP